MADDLHSEEDVKIKMLLPYLKERGYKENLISYNVAIEIQEGRKKKTIYADAVVYSSAARKAPILVCETKAPSEAIGKSAKEQAISYARLLPRISPLALVTNGLHVQVFHTLDKTRIADLPKFSDLKDDIVKFVLNKDLQDALRQEAKHDLFIIDDVATFKNLLKACHNEIRNNDGLDPTAAFDEMSKVMFCKLYEEKENPKDNRFKLGLFDETLKKLKINIVSKIFEEAKSSAAYSGLFLPDSVIKLQDRTIRKIVQLLEGYDLGLTAFDVKGEAFEYFLGDTFTGGLGEFFTPRNVVEFMVDVINPKIGEKIIDPFCGTGGFLIYAFDIVSEKIRLQDFSADEKSKWRLELSNKSLFGTDWKERTSQACKMNMMVHGDGSSGIFMHDGLSNVEGKISEGMFDVCLTNPPFGSFETDNSVLKKFELGRGRKSQDRIILAIERSIDLLKPGGRIATVVIDGVLNNSSTKSVREFIKKHTWIKAIISLNRETFEGYGARAKTSILVLEKKKEPCEEGQAPVFMAIAKNTGLAPNGASMPGNMLPDILLDYKAFMRGEAFGSHSGAWQTELRDRLDAEHYVALGERVASDLDALRTSIASCCAEAENSYQSLLGFESFISDLETEPFVISDLVTQVQDKHQLDRDESYRLLGVRWWGAGAFVRETKRGSDIKAKYLYRLTQNLIVYNRLFAFKGSFAVTGPEHDGCFVSYEFPTFKVKENVDFPDFVAQYIVDCLNSPQYLAAVDAESTGSTKTSRNRFDVKQFLQMTIHIPRRNEDLQRVVLLLSQAGELRRQQERLLSLSKILREDVLGSLPRP